MTTLVGKIVSCHEHLQAAQVPHAFGGALALAWCTAQARGTIDIDINLFVDAARAGEVLAALPVDIRRDAEDLAKLQQETQIRLWWDATPIDLFLNSTPYHTEVQTRVRWEAFAGSHLPFLSCPDLAVFKAFFNRTKDWADLEAMRDAGTLDVRHVIGVLVEYLGADDERVRHLRELVGDRRIC